MFRPLILPALAALALAGGSVAFAQTKAPSPDSGPEIARAEPAGQDLSKQIHDKLAEQGFKDIEIKPTAFMVRAKDKEGKQVMMLIGPDSMTVLTAPDGVQGGGAGLNEESNKPIKE